MVKRVLAFGTFDILHAGHLFYLEKAKSYGDELYVVVARDETVKKIKNKEPLHDQDTRLKLVQALKPVTQTVLGHDFFEDKFEIVQEVKPSVIVVGYDQKVDEKKLEQDLSARGLNVQVIRIESYKSKNHKSSHIRKHLEQSI